MVLRRSGLDDIPTWTSRHPYARVLACATNNDGHTKEGITFPSGPAQKALAQEVLCLPSLDYSKTWVIFRARFGKQIVSHMRQDPRLIMSY